MLRIAIALCLSLLGFVVQAALPAASLDASSAQEIISVFKEQYEDDFRADMARIPRSAIPTYEQSYVYAKYMNKAFANAGYSLDQTLYEYLKADRTANVVFFMSKLNLENYATFLKTNLVASAFLKVGAASEKTLTYARDIAREIPISNADYIIEADPAYVIEGLPGNLERRNERLLGYVRQGTGPWKKWLYLESLRMPGEQYGIGLIDITDTSQREMAIWKSLINKKVKMEGTCFTAKGIQLGVPGNNLVATDPSFFDKKNDMIFKIL